MRKLTVMLAVLTGFAVLNLHAWTQCDPKTWHHKGQEPKPALYDAFEHGIPKTWSLQGKGKLSLNPWHYKLGKNSLQWDFKAGDVIRINNSIGNPLLRGLENDLCFANFGVWIYVPKSMKGKYLRFEFFTDNKRTAYFDAYLNYKGWQWVSVRLSGMPKEWGKGSARKGTNNIRIVAPKEIDGQVMIDLMVYNSPLYYYSSNVLPRKIPFKARTLDSKRYPVPSRVSKTDKIAMKRVKNELLFPVKITEKGSYNGTAYYKKAMKTFKFYDIVEDKHGIRGKPINVGFTSRDEPQFLQYAKVPANQIIGYQKGRGIPPKGEGNWKAWKDALNQNFPVLTIALRNGVTQSQYDDLAKESVITWKFLIDQGMNPSCGKSPNLDISNGTLRGSYPFNQAFYENGIGNEIFNTLQLNPLLRLVIEDGNVTGAHTDYFTKCGGLFYLAILYSESPRKQLQALQYLSKRLSFELSEDHGSVGFKPDGAGWRGIRFVCEYYQNCLLSLAKIAYVVHDSSFALSDKAYKILKKSLLTAYFYTQKAEVPIFLQGTHPIIRKSNHGPSRYKIWQLSEALKYLALAGKDGCDKELAQAYVNLKNSHIRNFKYDDIFEKKYGIKPSALPQGNLRMNYAHLMAHRRKGWLAVASHFKPVHTLMRQRGNHYMYHGFNVPLSILGPEGFHASGTEEYGWDWNRESGATVLYMPHLIDMKYIHTGQKPAKGFKRFLPKWLHPKIRDPYLVPIQWRIGSKDDPFIKRPNGGTSWRKTDGVFSAIFFEDYRLKNNFWGIKSYFFVGNRIYAVGSNIFSDNKKFHCQTNLYQKALYKLVWDGKGYTDKDYKRVEFPHRATYVDGKKITAFPVPDKELAEDKAHHLIDPQGNGYFVPKGQEVFVARKHQKSRTGSYKLIDHEGDFATAWLDHGIACKDAKYVYVVFPYCNKEKFAKFSSKDFEILQLDSIAHILHDKIDDLYMASFFREGEVKNLPHVKHIDHTCQIIYREKDGKLEVAVGDPDPHRNWSGDTKHCGRYAKFGGKSEMVPEKVTFAGAWKLEKPVGGVKIVSAKNNETVIEFATIHGEEFYFTLIK